jgi:hypothetical protein
MKVCDPDKQWPLWATLLLSYLQPWIKSWQLAKWPRISETKSSFCLIPVTELMSQQLATITRQPLLWPLWSVTLMSWWLQSLTSWRAIVECKIRGALTTVVDVWGQLKPSSSRLRATISPQKMLIPFCFSSIQSRDHTIHREAKFPLQLSAWNFCTEFHWFNV